MSEIFKNKLNCQIEIFIYHSTVLSTFSNLPQATSLPSLFNLQTFFFFLPLFLSNFYDTQNVACSALEYTNWICNFSFLMECFTPPGGLLLIISTFFLVTLWDAVCEKLTLILKICHSVSYRREKMLMTHLQEFLWHVNKRKIWKIFLSSKFWFIKYFEH